MNEGRIYRYKQLMNGIYESIVISMDTWLNGLNKYRYVSYSEQCHHYEALTDGAWIGIGPFIRSECTQEEEEVLFSFWEDIINRRNPFPK